jgi:hypothetical protein
MPTRNLLYAREYKINEHISIQIPTLGEILDNEDDYYSMIYSITATPYDMMVQLDDLGIDFTTITDFELFLVVFQMLRMQDTTLVFGGLDLKEFVVDIHPQNKKMILIDKEHNIVIDDWIHNSICEALRRIHGLKRNNKKPANGEAKRYMLERARKKLKRRQGKVQESALEELIIALVNTEQFSYTYESVRNMSIYQFNESLHQIAHKINFDNIMRGVYAGTVSAKDLNPKELNWLSHK